MITKNISAPTGAGICRFVAPLAAKAAAERGGAVTIIVAVHEIKHQWRRELPDAAILTSYEWQKRGADQPNDIVILDQQYPPTYRRIGATLKQLDAEVWALNAPVDPSCPEFLPPSALNGAISRLPS